MPAKKSVKSLKKHITNKEKEERTKQEELTKVNKDDLLPPSYLDEYAQNEFIRIVTELKSADIIDNLDKSLLAIYSDAISNSRQASIDINKTGLFIEDPKTGKITANPSIAIQKQYSKIALDYASKLGINSIDRLKLTPIQTKAEMKVNKFDKFL